MQIWAGLGNPGPKYSGHRHNVGFMAVARIAERHGFGPWRARFSGETAEGVIEDEKILILKPLTFMNRSGQSIAEAARFFKLGPADVAVFYDEIDLAPGRLRMKTGGGAAGHNGIRSTISHLSADFRRVRLGIGHPGHKELVHGFVLHDFGRHEREWLDPLLDACAGAAPFLAARDDERFQTEVMRLAPAPKGDPRQSGEAK